MAIKNPYQAYQTNSVTTASPGELTLMLYNGCLKFLHLGKKAIEEGNVQEKNNKHSKSTKHYTRVYGDVKYGRAHEQEPTIAL